MDTRMSGGHPYRVPSFCEVQIQPIERLPDIGRPELLEDTLTPCEAVLPAQDGIIDVSADGSLQQLRVSWCDQNTGHSVAD
jgi:hypothetical protein